MSSLSRYHISAVATHSDKTQLHLLPGFALGVEGWPFNRTSSLWGPDVNNAGASVCLYLSYYLRFVRFSYKRAKVEVILNPD